MFGWVWIMIPWSFPTFRSEPACSNIVNHDSLFKNNQSSERKTINLSKNSAYPPYQLQSVLFNGQFFNPLLWIIKHASQIDAVSYTQTVHTKNCCVSWAFDEMLPSHRVTLCTFYIHISYETKSVRGITLWIYRLKQSVPTMAQFSFRLFSINLK